MPKLYVVRHGRTEFNEQGRLRGWMNPPLSMNGVEDAHALSLLLPKDLPVYCSDLLRAQQTATAIAPLPFVTYELRPWNVGEYAGWPSAVVHPLLMKHMERRSVPPGGERFGAFAARLRICIERLPDCIVVTHYRCMRLLMANFRSERLLKDEEVPTVWEYAT